MLKLEEGRVYQDEEGEVWLIHTNTGDLSAAIRSGTRQVRIFRNNGDSRSKSIPSLVREYRTPWFDHYLEAWEEGIVIEKYRATVVSIRVEHLLPRIDPIGVHVHVSLTSAFDDYGITGRPQSAPRR